MRRRAYGRLRPRGGSTVALVAAVLAEAPGVTGRRTNVNCVQVPAAGHGLAGSSTTALSGGVGVR